MSASMPRAAGSRRKRDLAWAVVVGCVAASVWIPEVALAALAAAVWPLAQASRSVRGTSLGGALAWGWVLVALGSAGQFVALLEPIDGGRPWCGHLTYLMVIAALASQISILNARTPGAGAWALLTALLFVVFMIPWLQAPTLARHAGGLERLRLDAPWSIFYGLLVLAAVTNHLPTRYGPAALLTGGAYVLEFLGLTHHEWTPVRLGHLWSVVTTLLAGAVVAAGAVESVDDDDGAPRYSLDRVWQWFRDRWGVVWALRVRDRFNRGAEVGRASFRLGWNGLESTSDAPLELDPAADAEATALLIGLLRRFARPERIARGAEVAEAIPPRHDKS